MRCPKPWNIHKNLSQYFPGDIVKLLFFIFVVLCINSCTSYPPIKQGEEGTETIRSVMLDHTSHFRNCYEKELIKDANYVDKCTLYFSIEPDGTVTNTSAKGMKNETVKKCIIDTLNSIKFPIIENKSRIEITQPLNFVKKN